jgi:hypothetical protein
VSSNSVNRELLKAKADSLADNEVQEVLEYISIMESLRDQNSIPDPFDEVLLRLLSEAWLESYAAKTPVKN